MATLSDGVQRIKLYKDRTARDKRRGIFPTPLCQGHATEVLEQLARERLKPHRIWVMRLTHEGFAMKWHRDADVKSWRLHIPIITNLSSFYEWKLADESV
ncbi:MAG: hypothetical protein QM778_00175 [Myxococcales bacterium]